MEKLVQIECLFLDLQTCDRCIGTDHVLEEVIKSITPTLELAGYQVEYRKVEMSTPELAVQYRFLSSPTIRVNGRDICPTVLETGCGCCGQISGTDVDCRVFEYEGQTYEVPPKAMLTEAILRGIFAPVVDQICDCYSLPDNLKAFFDGKTNKGDFKWYPVIDILTCIECGTCVRFCPNGVYDKTKVPIPVVINPDACIDHCHGCEKKCPVGAISYVGDTGGKADAVPSCGCSCGG